MTSGISATGLGLPAATGLPAPSTMAATAAQQQASTFDHETNPTALDKPDASYPALTVSHVAVLKAIGTPEAVIAQLAAQSPQAEYLDRYIQGEIMQNPEGWDDYVGNPRGTARAGLAQIMPNAQLPAAGGGKPGYLADGSPVSGINVPGLSTPLLDPATGTPGGGGEGLVKGLFIAAAVVGVGLIGWKFMKGRKPDAVIKGAEGFGNVLAGGKLGGPAAAGALGGGAGGALGGLGELGQRFLGHGVENGSMDTILRGATLEAFAQGGGGMVATHNAATAYGIMHGLAPGDGYVQSISAAAKFAGIGETMAHRMSQESRWMGVIEQMARNGGTLGDLAAAGIVSSQALKGGGAAAAGQTAHLAGLQQIFQGAANALV